ncbi:sulfotransferase [uncultured Psychroserpens sp.]|uniref:sulfotransferase family protein n=1 Tax=uncultured Psychroserpens sp. TaxID=255436 RepID=UPI002633669C|nr:sulfotransferase [uncultured Psychroserpens sp.]
MTYQNVFIIGSPRSGTSLFRMMMSSHSSIVVPPECGFIQWWYEDYKDWNIENTQSIKDVQSYISNLKTSKKIETWNLDYLALETLIKTKQPKSYQELTSLVIHQYGIQKEKGASMVLGDKNNYYIDHLDLLNHIYPNAKYLIIVRDSRDVVCSCLKVNSLATDSKYKPKFPETIKDISLDWLHKNETILSFLESISPSNYALIRYEDLLNEPQIELQKCTEVLNLQFEDQMLDYYKNKMEPSALLDWKKKTNEQLDKNNTQKYLEQLSAAQIDEIMSVSGHLMSKFGYH